MNTRPQKTAIEARGERGASPGQPRWARWLRRALLCGVGLLFAASIPWYRGDAPPAKLFGAVAILCYAAAAILNSAAWLLTDIPEPVADDEARKS